MSIPFLNPTASNVADWLRKAATSVNLLIGGKQDRSDVLDDVSALSYTGNANKLIRVKGTEDGLELATVSGSGLADGDYGDIVVSSGGTAINFDTSVVTAFAKTFLDDADAASVRTTIGAQASGSYQTQDATLTALASFNTNGIICQTAADTFAGRTLTGPAAGITVTNGDGVSGNPTLALANDLAALEALTGTNTIYYRSAADTWSAVTVGSGLTFSSGTLSSNPNYIGTYTFSAQSSVDIENFAGLSNRGVITLDIEYLTVSADSIGVTAQFKLNGAYKTSSYKWSRRNIFAATTASNNGSASDSNISIFLTGGGGMGNQSGEGGSGTIEIFNAYDTAGQKRLTYRVVWIDDQATPRQAYADGAGSYSGTDFASALTGVRLATSSGTMSGRIHVYARSYT